MKRFIIILSIIAFNCSFIFSQATVFDGLTISDNDISGTARYSGMAGAFGALGGDASAIKDNPAALGVFRKSEVSYTLNGLLQNSSAQWTGVNMSDNLWKLGSNNFSLIFALPTWRSESGASGLLSSNFSFTYNKLKNFDRNIKTEGSQSSSSITDYLAYFTDGKTQDQLIYVPGQYEPFNSSNVSSLSVLAFEGYLINEISANSGKWESVLGSNEKVIPSYTLSESGKIGEYSFAWSGNFNNIFYLGLSANIQSINYFSSSTYNENFSIAGSMSLQNTNSTTGSGVNFNLGAIATPTDFLRLGFALHTPTFYSIKTISQATLDYDTEKAGYVQSPEYTTNYQFQTPFQYNISGAFIFDKKGLISAEYVYKNLKGMKFSDSDNSTNYYDAENDDVKNMLNDTRTIKIGGEYRMTDNVSLRAGYANVSASTNDDAVKLLKISTKRADTEYFLRNGVNYYTAGFGYREAGWYLDFAYMLRSDSQSYYAYNSTNLDSKRALTPADVKINNNNFVVTLGLRF